MHWKDKPAPAYLGKWARSKWAEASLKERALYVARSQEEAKVREVTANWSPQIRKYLALTGIFSPAPWCAAFVTWCLVEAGADRKKLPALAASTYWWFVWAKQTKRLKVDKRGRPVNDPERGDLGGWNTGAGHIFFVLAVDEEKDVATLEGNTDNAGSREGVAVKDRVRSWPQLKRHLLHGYIRITDDLGVGA